MFLIAPPPPIFYGLKKWAIMTYAKWQLLTGVLILKKILRILSPIHVKVNAPENCQNFDYMWI